MKRPKCNTNEEIAAQFFEALELGECLLCDAVMPGCSADLPADEQKATLAGWSWLVFHESQDTAGWLCPQCFATNYPKDGE